MTRGDTPDRSLAEQWADWQGHAELRFQRCTSCRTWLHLPRVMCPECGSEELGWELSAGTGTLHSWTRTHRAFNPAFGVPPPYTCAVVEMDEGVRLLTRLVDAPDDDLPIGATVTVGFEPSGPDLPALAVFRLTRSPSGELKR